MDYRHSLRKCHDQKDTIYEIRKATKRVKKRHFACHSILSTKDRFTVFYTAEGIFDIFFIQKIFFFKKK